MGTAISKHFATPARIALASVVALAACSEGGDAARTRAEDASEAATSLDAASDAPLGSGGSDATSLEAGNGTAISDAQDVAASSPRDADDSMPGADTMVTAFSRTHVFFTGYTMSGNQRTVDRIVEFPEPGLTYENITLGFTLSCPTGGCDAWDRRAFLGVVSEPGTSNESVTEILRFATPYGVSAHWSTDVTALRPLLTGKVTLRVFIDTWVGPGNPAGAGWLVDVQFDLHGGVPARWPLAVLPVWNEMSFEVGNPSKPISQSVPTKKLTLPQGAGDVELRALITGHGQGNADNCAEFCAKKHVFTVGQTPYERLVWRTDCARTPVAGQRGTWKLSRSGWCPGADVVPWILDVTGPAASGEVTISYEPEPYVNTCRPNAGVCSACALGTGCAYDDANHTMPVYVMSALLVVYRP